MVNYFLLDTNELNLEENIINILQYKLTVAQTYFRGLM